MPTTSKPFDFRKRVAYDDNAKEAFHRNARRQLKLLAAALGLPTGAFDLRSNKGGIAVSGEITCMPIASTCRCASPQRAMTAVFSSARAEAGRITTAVPTILRRLTC
jgi:hypothetical protein